MINEERSDIDPELFREYTEIILEEEKAVPIPWCHRERADIADINDIIDFEQR